LARKFTHTISRRELVAGLAATMATAALLPRFARAQNLDVLNQGAEWAPGFDSGARAAPVRGSRYATLTQSTVQSLEEAINNYSIIVRQRGWPEVPYVQRLRVGTSHRAVSAMRERLIITGDLNQVAGVSNVYDSYTESAVRRFQARNGLTPDGVIRESTIAAMNVPAEVRLRQLETNIVRVRSMAGFLGERYVVVNLPAAHLEAVENGNAVLRHTTIVGKPDRASPVLQAKITEVNFHPFWTVPASIVRKDLIPKMQQEPDYLYKNRIRIYDQRGRELASNQVDWFSNDATNYMFRQDPGEQNSMGTIRVNMPNPHAVYMHDTPSKNLFGEELRFHSSGCVRIQNIRDFVAWLLRDGAGWTRQHVDQAIAAGERVDAKLARVMPVYWVYITAWANPDGVVQFRDDVYGHDGLGIRPMASYRG